MLDSRIKRYEADAMKTGAVHGEIEEEDMALLATAPAREVRVAVAVGKDDKTNKELLRWAMRNSRGKKIFILHVHTPAQRIPTPLGKIPASQVKPSEVRNYRQLERGEMDQALDSYVLFCAGERVRAESLVIEMGDIGKGIIELVIRHGISNLVMGASTDRKMKELKSKKAVYVGREAPVSCHVWFICCGFLVFSRETNSDGTTVWRNLTSPVLSSCRDIDPTISCNSRSVSLGVVGLSNRRRNALLDFFTRSRSENITTTANGMGLLSCAVEDAEVSSWSTGKNCDEGRSDSQRSMASIFPSSKDGVEDSVSIYVDRNTESDEDQPVLPSENNLGDTECIDFVLNEQECVEDHQVYGQLELAMKNAEISRKLAHELLIKRQNFEKDVVNAILKAKASENMFVDQIEQRLEIEKLLASEVQDLEQDKLLHKETMEVLHKAYERQSELNIQVPKSQLEAKELEEKLSEAQRVMENLRMECDNLQQEFNRAIKEVEELRGNEVASLSFLRESGFKEFSFVEIEEATNNFDPSLEIGRGGYGIVYKGILHSILVAIKVLLTDSRQGQPQFQQEVDILSRLTHQNLVNLFGTCPEAWSLVYEYLPNGSLEDRIACKDDTAPLSWRCRICILADVCSALIFLHSKKPQGVVHGDLKPANILLDSNYVAKLGDFGICRLVSPNSMTTRFHTTDPQGSFMYIDPEFASTGELTTRSDVYSFGIIILRLLTGKSALGIVKEVRSALEAGNLHDILDELAGDWPFVQAMKLARLGLQCCEMNRKNRPDLKTDVWTVLEPLRASTGLPLSFRLPSESIGQIPSYFICPIYLKIMLDPHVASDGFTYEGEAFRGWLADGHATSPVTNAQLANYDLIPNRALKSAIQEWLQRH